MKIKKSTRNTLIGIAGGLALAACMGADNWSQAGSFQISAGSSSEVYILDTRTGHLWERAESQIVDFGTPTEPISQTKVVKMTQ
ncbi:MAG: hypothetical protein AB7F23_02495 [Phycisphaerae bacterium]|jgi:hypothetical protein